MKKNIKLFIAIIIASFAVISCEEVIDVNLDTAAPKLVIDASIKWQKGTTGNTQKIKLTTSTDFYSGTIPVATGASVSVTNISLSTPITYQFIEVGQSGEYICTNFTPIINNNYALTIVYNGEIYTSKSQFTATPDIVKTEQSLKPGFGGDDIYEVKFYFQDNGAEDNFYVAGIKNTHIVFPEYGVLDDKFTQGNLMFVLYRDEDLKKGDIIDYTLQGITEKYSNYMSKLLNIAGTGSGSPFATAPATVRGNIVNTTHPDNYPFGFFQLSEIDSGSLTIQ